MWSGTKTTSANSHPVNCSLYSCAILLLYMYSKPYSSEMSVILLIPHGIVKLCCVYINFYYGDCIMVGVLWVPLVNVGGAMRSYGDPMLNVQTLHKY